MGKFCHILVFNYFDFLRFEKDVENVPLEDRQKALSLLLELSLQRGTLYHILDCILLLLYLADKATRSNELLKTELDKEPPLPPEEELNYPLVPFLRRISNIPTSSSYIPVRVETVGFSISNSVGLFIL